MEGTRDPVFSEEAGQVLRDLGRGEDLSNLTQHRHLVLPSSGIAGIYKPAFQISLASTILLLLIVIANNLLLREKRKTPLHLPSRISNQPQKQNKYLPYCGETEARGGQGFTQGHIAGL